VKSKGRIYVGYSLFQDSFPELPFAYWLALEIGKKYLTNRVKPTKMEDPRVIQTKY
jgi:hypothetical protein